MGSLQIKYNSLESKYNDGVDDYGMMHDKSVANANKLKALPANLCNALQEQIEKIYTVIAKEIIEKQPGDVEEYIRTRSHELIANLDKVEVKFEKIDNPAISSWSTIVDLSKYQPE